MFTLWCKQPKGRANLQTILRFKICKPFLKEQEVLNVALASNGIFKTFSFRRCPSCVLHPTALNLKFLRSEPCNSMGVGCMFDFSLKFTTKSSGTHKQTGLWKGMFYERRTSAHREVQSSSSSSCGLENIWFGCAAYYRENSKIHKRQM